MWIDSHCHLDAAEFANDALQERARAAAAGVCHCILPAVEVKNFDAVRVLAHATGDSYCLGIHPLYVAQATDLDLHELEAALTRFQDDPRLVAVGEIGLDYFVPELAESPLREKQEHFFRAQLKLAQRHGLPVVLHVRRSVDRILKYLRALAPAAPAGIAHAFNGSDVQARALTQMGFKLGFGGALTYDRATHLRALSQSLPLDALVLETDSPDIVPHWLYRTADERRQGHATPRNSPAELPRIGAELAQVRGISADAMAHATSANVCDVLPRVRHLLV